jgi:hypothetical protein
MGSGKGYGIGKSVLRRPRPRARVEPYGALGQTQALVYKVGKAAFYQAAQAAAQSISTALVPQFAIPFWTGYCIWNYGTQVYKDVVSSDGTLEDRIIRAVTHQACQVVLDAVLSDVIGQSVETKIDHAVLEASSYLSRQGVFREITAGLGLGTETSDDLREFFTTTASNILNDLYTGAQSEIIDYISER